jgi:hypothetical protein
VTTTVELFSLELRDVLKFRGVNLLAFARPPAPGGRALTLVTGGGATGKSCLVTALGLALWGGRGVGRAQMTATASGYRGDDPFAKPELYINAAALGDREPRASACLDATVRGRGEGSEAVRITRFWRAVGGGRVVEDVAVVSESAGRRARLEGAAAEAWIGELLPPRRPSLFTADGHLLHALGRLAADDPRWWHETRDVGLTLLRGRPAGSLVQAGRVVKLFTDRALGSWDDPRVPSLVEADAGRRREGRPLFPGIWLRISADAVTPCACLGAGLALGLSTTGPVRAPLILDGPMNGVVPSGATRFLEALSDVAPEQLIVTAHDCQVDALAVLLFDSVHRVYLMEDRMTAETTLLGEPTRDTLLGARPGLD